MTRIRVGVLPVGKPLDLVDVDATLEAFQGLVGGGYVEAVGLFGRVSMMVNEDGRSLELPPNLTHRGAVILGPVFFTRVDLDSGDSVSLTDDDVKRIRQCLVDARRMRRGEVTT